MQLKQMAEVYMDARSGFLNSNIDLATQRDVVGRLHLAGSEHTELTGLPPMCEGQHNFLLGAGRVPEVDQAIKEMAQCLRPKLRLSDERECRDANALRDLRSEDGVCDRTSAQRNCESSSINSTRG